MILKKGGGQRVGFKRSPEPPLDPSLIYDNTYSNKFDMKNIKRRLIHNKLPHDNAQIGHDLPTGSA